MMEFLWLALAAGLGITLVSGPLGSLLVWRRMAFFGDTLAHGALLGIALSLFFQFSNTLGIVIAAMSLGLALAWLQTKRQIGNDTLLGILSHSTLALGIIAISVVDTPVDIEALLFGDVLAVSTQQVLSIWGLGIATLLLLIKLWRPLLSITVQPELAAVEGVNVHLVQLGLTLALALTIAVAMQAVGVLLVTALLIIPAAAARPPSHNPEQMAILASVIGGLSVCLGLAASWFYDVPAGPAIVVASTLLLLMARLIKK
ncbi:MAG: metal ABC transporter permease [Cellvibrionaceae bacterium]